MRIAELNPDRSYLTDQNFLSSPCPPRSSSFVVSLKACCGRPEQTKTNSRINENNDKPQHCNVVRVARRPEGTPGGRKAPHPADGRGQRQTPRASLGENREKLSVRQPERA